MTKTSLPAILIIILTLSSCASPTSVSTPTLAATNANLPAPQIIRATITSPAALPTATPAPENTAEPVPPANDNLSEASLRLGRGALRQVIYSPDGSSLVTASDTSRFELR